jgi:hypothetical protein
MVRMIVPLLVLLVAFPACVQSPQVVEGTVTSYDQAANTLILVDPKAPDTPVTLSLEGADVGASPVVGDTVRIAYLERDGKPTALRVMNVSRQEEQTGIKH